jgi:mRNA interferase YafQ
MLTVRTTGQFKKDFKQAQKRGLDLEKLRAVMTMLVNEQPLPARIKDHVLSGNFKGRRECHIGPDWMLVYKVDTKAEEITFERTGTHSDLFE